MSLNMVTYIIKKKNNNNYNKMTYYNLSFCRTEFQRERLLACILNFQTQNILLRKS